MQNCDRCGERSYGQLEVASLVVSLCNPCHIAWQEEFGSDIASWLTMQSELRGLRLAIRGSRSADVDGRNFTRKLLEDHKIVSGQIEQTRNEIVLRIHKWRDGKEE